MAGLLPKAILLSGGRILDLKSSLSNGRRTMEDDQLAQMLLLKRIPKHVELKILGIRFVVFCAC